MAKVYSTYVPNEGNFNSPLWLVGEAPGQTEEVQRSPFVGEAGQLLMEVLRNHGVNRNDIYLANLCNYRPYGNDFKNCIGTRELTESLGSLYEAINKYRPICIIALGSYPLSYLTRSHGIERYRGSIISWKDDRSIKVVPTRHPSAVLRDRKEYPIFDFDIGRGIQESKSREYNYPEYEFVIDPQGLEKEEWTAKLSSWPTFISSDIENVKARPDLIICVGFGISPTKSIVYPWNTNNIPHISRILESSVEKCFHFGTHDTTVLEENGLKTNNYLSDTMALQHILNPELPRSLAFLTSIYTRQQYYKTEGRKSLPEEGKGWSAKTDLQKVYAYNGTDCCVTWDIALQLKKELQERSHLIDLFNYEMEMIQIAREISRTGMLIDQQRRRLLLNSATLRWRKRQGMFNLLVSFHNKEVGKDANVNSPARMKELLYETLKLPIKKKRDGKITTDEDSIVELLTYVKSEREKVSRPDAVSRWTEKEVILGTIIEIRGLRKLISSYLNTRLSSDSRLRSTYKVQSVETGRWACELFVDKSGVNAQTFPREGYEVSEEDMNRENELTEKELKELEQDTLEEIEDEMAA